MTSKYPVELNLLAELRKELGLDVSEVAGRVKWFDVGKGFGYIVPDDGTKDILLHVTCLRRDGYETAYEGAHIVVDVVDRPRGPQVLRIITMDDSNVVHPTQESPSRSHIHVTPTSGLEKATVKWFNRIRGFGFLTQGEGSEDIFFHMETLVKYNLSDLRPGQEVLVRFGDGPKGRMASEVRPVGTTEAALEESIRQLHQQVEERQQRQTSRARADENEINHYNRSLEIHKERWREMNDHIDAKLAKIGEVLTE